MLSFVGGDGCGGGGGGVDCFSCYVVVFVFCVRLPVLALVYANVVVRVAMFAEASFAAME